MADCFQGCSGWVWAMVSLGRNTEQEHTAHDLLCLNRLVTLPVVAAAMDKTSPRSLESLCDLLRSQVSLGKISHHSFQFCRWLFGITSELHRNLVLRRMFSIRETAHPTGSSSGFDGIICTAVRCLGFWRLLYSHMASTKFGVGKISCNPVSFNFSWTAWHIPFSLPFPCSKSCPCWQPW